MGMKDDLISYEISIRQSIFQKRTVPVFDPANQAEQNQRVRNIIYSHRPEVTGVNFGFINGAILVFAFVRSEYCSLVQSGVCEHSLSTDSAISQTDAIRQSIRRDDSIKSRKNESVPLISFNALLYLLVEGHLKCFAEKILSRYINISPPSRTSLKFFHLLPNSSYSLILFNHFKNHHFKAYQVNL